MAKKKSVLFYLDNYTPAMKGLSYEQKGMLFDAIISYAGGLADTPDELGMLSLALDPIKAAIDRDNVKYVQVCERNQKNGLKGGKPKGTHSNPQEPTGLFTNPNKPDKDNDTDTIQIRIGDKDKEEKNSIPSGNDLPKKATKRFIPPTLEEVTAYCQEKNNGVDAYKWFHHYESNGWMIGKNKMARWKSAVATWAKPQTKPSEQPLPLNRNRANEYT